MNDSNENQPDPGSAQPKQIFTIQVGSEWFGIPIEHVRTIFQASNITPVPLSPAAVAGLVNVRGEVMTAIYAAKCLDITDFKYNTEMLIVGIEYDNESFGLIVSQAGDIVDVHGKETVLLPQTRSAHGPAGHAKPAGGHRVTLPTYNINGNYYPVIDLASFFSSLNAEPQAA